MHLHAPSDLNAEVLNSTIADGRLVDRQLIRRINALNIHLLWVGLDARNKTSGLQVTGHTSM